SIQCANRKGLKISHRGRQVNRTDFRDFDYIIAMDDSNLRNLQTLRNSYKFPGKEICLMRDFVPGSEGLSVPDPYYGGEEGFDEIYQILYESIDNFLTKIQEAHQLYA